MIRNSFLLFVFFASLLPSQTRVELSKQVKGSLPPSSGGTGLSSCAENEVLVWQSGAFVCSPSSAGPHATTHQHGGSDEVATATPADNAIPKAGPTGTLTDGWIPSSLSRDTESPASGDISGSLSTGYTINPDADAKLNASDFDFSQSPAQSLTASVAATVTLAPCPLGVDGTHTGHYLRILDAISGNENVLLTGGTCTSGASSGTIQFTPASSHTSGNWSVTSASDGIQEAIWEAGSGKFVFLDGTFNVHATIYVGQTSTALVGKGHGNLGSRIRPQSSSMTVFEIANIAGVERFRAENFLVDAFALGANTVTVFNGTDLIELYFNRLFFFAAFRAFNLHGSQITVRDISFQGNVTAFFGDTTGLGHTFDLLIDGWQQTNAGIPYTSSTAPITLQRVVNSAVRNVIFRGLNNAPAHAIVLANGCEAVQITDSFLINSQGGILLDKNTVGPTTTGPKWNLIDNVICDQISTTCVDIEDDALFTTMNQLYVTNPDAGARAGVLVRSGGNTRGTIVSSGVFQNMVTGFAGIEVEAGVNSFEIKWGIHLTQVTPRCSMRLRGGLSTRPARVRGTLRQRRGLSRLSVRVALAGGFPLSGMRA